MTLRTVPRAIGPHGLAIGLVVAFTLVACSPDGPDGGGDHPGVAAPTPAAQASSLELADEIAASWLRATWNPGSEVARASCDVHVRWGRPEFREPIQWDGRFEYGDGQAKFRWHARGGDASLDAELERLFDPGWLRRDLSGPIVATPEGPLGAMVVRAGGANSLHATSITFGAGGRLEAAVVRVTCADGVEREGPQTYTYEGKEGRQLLVRRSIAFPDAECAEEVTIRWTEQQGLALPAEIQRRRTRGKKYESVTYQISGWAFDLAAGK